MTLRSDTPPWSAKAQRGFVPSSPAPAARVTWAFEAGLPDPATFPAEDLARLTTEVLRAEPELALQYNEGGRPLLTYGYGGLRAALAERLRQREGIEVEVDGVMLTLGAVHALTLALEAFLDPGDVVAVEAPTWNHVLTTVARMGARAVAIPMDDDGLRVDRLEDELAAAAAAGHPVKVVYTIATFHTPTGVTLPLERRQRLVELAERFNVVVIEDNVYGELRFSGEPVPSLLALAPQGPVVRVDSFSKVLAPGIRIGWLSGPRHLVDAVAAVRDDLGVSSLMARVMARYLAEGRLDPQIARVNALYERKRDVAEAALREHCGELVRWRQPQGGMFLWLQLDPRVDTAVAAARALEGGVACRPGERFFGNQAEGTPFLRLAYAPVPEDEIERGIGVLGDAIRFALR